MVKLYNIFKYINGVKVLALLFMLCFGDIFGQTIIFSENMGTTLSGNPGPGVYTGFQNYGTLVFSGTGDLRNTLPSSGYAGASGNNNVLINAVNETFEISGINTSACSSMTLSFGIYKANNAETGTNLVIEVSTDGVTYSALSMPALPSGSNGWYLRTITAGIPSAANLRIRFRALNSTPQFRIDDVILTGSCGGSTSITTGLVSSPPFALTDCTVTASGTVDFISSGTFNSGNVYTAQLSDASGSFASPVTLGTLTSTANTGTISITIPATTASGTGYLIRVVSNNPSTIGSNSSAFTITLTCTNSSTCSVGGAIGSNQTNFGCGSSAPCNLASIYSGFGVFCGNVDNTGCSSSCITAVVSTTYSLPAGCTASITAEYKARTGAGACSNSAMDSGDQLYISNSGGTVISQSASLTSCAAFTSNVSSSITSGCGNGDGTVKMNITGGVVTIGGVVDRGDEIITYTINFSGTCGLNCPTLLPITLLDFYGRENGDYNDIIWNVTSQENVVSYIVEKSEDGVNFRELNIQKARENSSGNQVSYFTQDADPSDGITYYRLSTIEVGGNWNIKNLRTISLDRSINNWECYYYQQEQNLTIEFKNTLPKNSTISLFDLSGKLLVDEAVQDFQTKINTQSFSEGIYFLRISTPYKTQNFKLIIQK